VTPPRVVFDCDPGIDDALALVVLCDAVRRGAIDLVAVIAVGGNVGIDRTAANAAFLVERLGLDVPVLAGAGETLAGGVPGDAAHVHGDDGIGGLWEPTEREVRPATAAEMVALIEEHAPVTLVATGPLTNVARMIEARRDLPGMIERLTVMGGALGDPAGNVTAHAEFNAWVDPEAAEVVLGAGIPTTLVPLDVTTKVTLDREHADALARSAGRRTLASELVRRGADLYESLGLDAACEMHDPLAAAVALDPSLLAVTTMPVRVDTEGERRGETRRCDDGSPPIEVALGVDAPAVTDRLFGILSSVPDR
jgi:inosine-uridine nucleoside N-ribohydrolase